MTFKALFVGTFDPPTLGHRNLIERAAGLVDELVVGVGRVTTKGSFFSLEKRVELVRKITDVKVDAFDGLAVDYAKEIGAKVLIRGVRAPSDLENELRMALANRQLGGIETLFLVCDEKYRYISSTLIREIGMCDHSLQDFVPSEIEQEVHAALAACK